MEIGLGLFLGLILLTVFLALKKKHGEVREARACAEKQWRWTTTMEEIEWNLRRWEIYAPLCLAGNFSPIEVSDDHKQATLRLIDRARPLIAPMDTAKTMVVPAPHPFKGQQEVLICDGNSVTPATIESVHAGIVAGSAILKVNYPNAEFGKIFSPGAFLVASEKTTLEYQMNSGEGVLLHERSNKGKREIARQLTDFTVQSQVDDSALQIKLHLGGGECVAETQIRLHRQGNVSTLGEFALRKGSLFFEPWTLLKSASGGT